MFSHNDAVKLTDEGVRFIVNDYDGRHVFWTPEDNMEIAMKLGSDICMQLDQCPGYPATRAYVERAVELSSMWAERCYKAHTRDDQHFRHRSGWHASGLAPALAAPSGGVR